MEGIMAIVQDIIRDGRHGPYAVATSEGIEGSITFSLKPTVWQEKVVPEPGTLVYLSELQKKKAGWRALHGRFQTSSDIQQASNGASKQ